MQNLSQTLEALAGQGVVLPTEIRVSEVCDARSATARAAQRRAASESPNRRSQAAVDVSLPLKRVDAGLVELGLWGRLRTSSGKDYYVAVVRAR